MCRGVAKGTLSRKIKIEFGIFVPVIFLFDSKNFIRIYKTSYFSKVNITLHKTLQARARTLCIRDSQNTSFLTCFGYLLLFYLISDDRQGSQDGLC